MAKKKNQKERKRNKSASAQSLTPIFLYIQFRRFFQSKTNQKTRNSRGDKKRPLSIGNARLFFNKYGHSLYGGMADFSDASLTTFITHINEFQIFKQSIRS
jgi:hypothetical protein